MKWKESYLSWNGIQSLQEGPEAHNQQISWIKENNQIQFHSSQIAEWNGLIDFINWWFSNTNPSNTSTFLLAFAKRKKSLMNLWGLPRRSSALGHRLFIPFHCAAQPTSLFFIKEKFVDCLLSFHFISLRSLSFPAELLSLLSWLLFLSSFSSLCGAWRPAAAHNPPKKKKTREANKSTQLFQFNHQSIWFHQLMGLNGRGGSAWFVFSFVFFLLAEPLPLAAAITHQKQEKKRQTNLPSLRLSRKERQTIHPVHSQRTEWNCFLSFLCWAAVDFIHKFNFTLFNFIYSFNQLYFYKKESNWLGEFNGCVCCPFIPQLKLWELRVVSYRFSSPTNPMNSLQSIPIKLIY